MIQQRSRFVQHCTCTKNVAMHSQFNIQGFQLTVATRYCIVIYCFLDGETVYSVHFFQRVLVKTWVFYPTISQRSCHLQHWTYLKKQPCTLGSICKSFKLLFQCEIVVFSIIFVMGKLYSVFAVTYNITAILPYTCTQNLANHSMFNLKEFQPAFSTG